MRKFVLATLAGLAIGTAAFAEPANAACRWNGYAWHCWHPHAWWWRHHHPWHAWWWHHRYAYYR
jgi:hypothetical protein